MKTLSLFDGISCGMLALIRAGLTEGYDDYYASEIDKYAIKISETNFPNIIRLGDVNNWSSWNLPEIDLLLAGSPCQGFSNAGKGLNFNDPRSALFFKFVDILRTIKPRYFLLENVKMKREWEIKISEILGVEAVLINSDCVSAQNRERLYWTNIPITDLPKDIGILLKDIVDGDCSVFRDKSNTILYTLYKENVKSMIKRNKLGLFVDRDKSYAIDANYYKGGNLKSYFEKRRRQLVFDGDYSKFRKLLPIECERLQTIPDNYTDCVSNTQRYKCIGNAWTVDVIAHILSYLKGLI